MYGTDKFGTQGYTLKRGADPYELLSTCELRLSLLSGVPFPTSSVTAATSIYLMQFGRGNRLLLYDTVASEWVPRSVDSEKSVAVPATRFRGFDVWGYWTGEAVALETTDWNQDTYTITSVAGGANPTITTSAAHGRSVGDLVGVDDIVGTAGTDATSGLNDTIWRVASVPTSTTLTLEGADITSLTYASGGTLFTVPNTRVTLASQDGVYCKTGDLSRRYLGTGMTTGTSGQCECSFGGVNSTPLWLLGNAYNQHEVELRYGDSTDNWTYTTDTYRPANNRGKLARCGFVVGLNEQQVEAEAVHLASNSDGTALMGTALDLDGLASNDGFNKIHASAGANQAPLMLANWRGHPGIGFHFLGWLEKSQAVGSTSWTGDSGLPNEYQTGLRVKLWA